MNLYHRILILTSFIICIHVQIVAGFQSPIARENVPVQRSFLKPRGAKTTTSAKIKSSSTATMVSTTATTKAPIETVPSEKEYEEHHNAEEVPVTLIPLSTSPIMLTSSKPLLSEEECSIVRRYFEYINNNDRNKIKQEKEGTLTKAQINQRDIERGAKLVLRLQDQIDELTGCPRHSGELPLPRYITYDPPCRDTYPTTHDKASINNNNNNNNNNNKQNNDSENQYTTITRDQLFPDGLHVDSNNGKFFRHVTILLYLTTNEFGATTFPLAKRRPSSLIINNKDDGSDDTLSSSCEIHDAAEKLIQGKVHHTQMTGEEDGELIHCAKTLEDSALEMFERDNNHCNNVFHVGEEKYGVRVVPSAGHICVFCNLEETNGGADPTSFHGGEMLMKSNQPDKAVLTFFKEIPMGTFTNQEEFTDRVCETRTYLLDRYFQSFLSGNDSSSRG